MARKEKPHIPQRPEELTAEWFTETLAERSAGATVTHVDPVEIGVGIGFVGEIFRCTLTWDRDDPDLPASVVAKVPSTTKANRALGEGLMAYEREINIYRDAHGQLNIPMPDHIYTAMDPNPAPWMMGVLEFLFDRLPLRGVNWLIDRLLSLPESRLRRYLLVMEDIADARPAAQFDGGSLEDAHRSLALLAKFHAANWMNEQLLEEQPLIWALSRNPKVFQAGYVRNRDQFIEHFGQLIGPGAVDHLDALQDEVPVLSRQLTTVPWTILHGDYRLDNILFREDGSIVVLDYQLLLWGRAGWDVAYFITTALDPKHRAEENDLLRSYHESLLAEGITDYAFDELIVDVRMAKELLAHRMVGSGDILDTEVEGRDQSFIELMVCRVCGWVDM